MPFPYNKDFTRRKSAYLHDLDCRTTGQTRKAQVNPPFYATVTTDEAIEAGECIAMVRLPRGFRVTGGQLSYTAAGGTAAAPPILALGDPFACGRLVGPCHAFLPNDRTGVTQGQFSCSQGTILKTGSVGDGCGIGYRYTCETDLVVTVLYNEKNANQGGWAGGGAVQTGASFEGAAVASGSTITVVVDGFVDPE